MFRYLLLFELSIELVGLLKPEFTLDGKFIGFKPRVDVGCDISWSLIIDSYSKLFLIPIELFCLVWVTLFNLPTFLDSSNLWLEINDPLLISSTICSPFFID